MGRASRASDAVSDVVFAALSAPPSADALPLILSTVQQSIGAELAGFYTHEWEGWTTPVHITPDQAWPALPYTRIRTSDAVRVHPGIRHTVMNHPDEPFAVTDIVSERVWFGSPTASAMRDTWGRQYHFAIPVTAALSGESDVWVLGRSLASFTASDREVAARLSPVLTAVALHRRALARLTIGEAAEDFLTQREAVILGLQARGLTARGIATQLYISPRTVQKHIEHVYRKLGVHRQQDAIRVSGDLGLLTR